jgi:hypothetical protein
MSSIRWTLTQTEVRSTLVAPTSGFGMGDVCPQADGATTDLLGGFVAVTPMDKRHADASWTIPGSLPWSPPVP